MLYKETLWNSYLRDPRQSENLKDFTNYKKDSEYLRDLVRETVIERKTEKVKQKERDEDEVWRKTYADRHFF